MPTSQPRSLSQVHSIIRLLNPQSIIDIGIGHGKSGVIMREYLDIMKYRYKPEDWKVKIYGIEVFKKYHNPIWDYAYDSVFVSDALEVISELPDVDLIVALDIWEHFQTAYALKLLNVCLQKTRYLMICTPKDLPPQGSVYGNQYERHIRAWSPKDFRKVPHILVTCTTNDWIIVLSSRDEFPNTIRRFRNASWHLFEGLRQAISIGKQKIDWNFG